MSQAVAQSSNKCRRWPALCWTGASWPAAASVVRHCCDSNCIDKRGVHAMYGHMPAARSTSYRSCKQFHGHHDWHCNLHMPSGALEALGMWCLRTWEGQGDIAWRACRQTHGGCRRVARVPVARMCSPQRRRPEATLRVTGQWAIRLGAKLAVRVHVPASPKPSAPKSSYLAPTAKTS